MEELVNRIDWIVYTEHLTNELEQKQREEASYHPDDIRNPVAGEISDIEDEIDMISTGQLEAVVELYDEEYWAEYI